MPSPMIRYLHPKLNAIAVGNMNGNDIASLLDRAIERSNAVMKLIEHDQTEVARSTPQSNGNGADHSPSGQLPTEAAARPFPRLRR